MQGVDIHKKSLIRCGDGELIILTGEHHPLFSYVFKRQLGYDPCKKTAKEVRDHLISAIHRCDILGVHNDKCGPNWRIEEYIDEHFPNAAKLRCSIDIHLHMMNDGYNELLRHQSVAVIGCRDIALAIKDKFTCERVDLFKIAPEMKYTTYYGERHYPDQFCKVKDWMKSLPHKGILLVSAGFVGKIYCNWWRDLGGSAFDSGSVMDIWAGCHTRGEGRGTDFKLQHKYTL